MACPIAEISVDELLSRNFARNPYPRLAKLQEEGPVHQVGDLPWFLVTRYDDCVAVLQDVETYSSEHHDFGPALNAIGIAPSKEVYAQMQAIGGARGNMVDTIPHRDPPSHGRQRRLVLKAITARFQHWEKFIEDQSAALVKVFDGRSEIDVMAEIAAPLPISVIGDIMGISPEYMPKIKPWTEICSGTSGRCPTDDEWLMFAQALSEQRRMFEVEMRRRLEAPSDDLIGLFAAATLEGRDEETGDEPLGFDEGVDLLTVLMLAGNDTTTQLLGSIFYYAATEPDLLDRIRADEALIPTVVEEALRLSTPVFTMMRFCKKEGEIGGVMIPPGSIVTVCFNMGSRDPKVFENPNAFEAKRPGVRRHLGFGRGIHGCPGAPLARLEAGTWLKHLSRNIASLSLAGPDAVRYDNATLGNRGMTHLNLRYEMLADSATR